MPDDRSDRSLDVVVLEVGPDLGGFADRLPDLLANGQCQGTHVLAVANPDQIETLKFRLAAEFPTGCCRCVTAAEVETLLEDLAAESLVGYAEADASLGPVVEPVPRGGPVAVAWTPVYTLPEGNVKFQTEPIRAWVAPASMACRIWKARPLGSGGPWEDVGLRWGSPAAALAARPPSLEGDRPPLDRGSRVLAFVPHFACEAWLAQCLDSLCAQTRPLDGIVVVDDGSARPPVAIVERFPRVTLLSSTTNVGPYRLLQEVIRSTDHDAYLLQDADDFSTVDRLELQLLEAERTGAELVGCQELRIHEGQGTLQANTFASDVNQAMATAPNHAVLHATSLVARSLVLRLGGFATGLRYGADTEFLFRAHHVGRLVNVPRFCYFRRMRPNSLTSSPLTGSNSPDRQRLRGTLQARARENIERVASGLDPLLEPLCIGPAITLDHITGPPL